MFEVQRPRRKDKMLTPAHLRYFVRDGPPDTNVCPIEADTNKVAVKACRLLNKYPLAIKAEYFPAEIDTRPAEKGKGLGHAQADLTSARSA
jgi:hypothetical protein